MQCVWKRKGCGVHHPFRPERASDALRFARVPHMLAAGLLCLVLAGCSNGAFDENRIRYLLEGGTIPLHGEQVILSPQQIECGTHAELWELESLGPGKSVGRLTPRARELKFDDDVQIGDMKNAYTQVRGDFSLQLLEVQAIKDEGAKTKIAEAKVSVRIDHACFANPVLLMGVRHGKFTQDFPPRFQFTQDGDDWQFDSIAHN